MIARLKFSCWLNDFMVYASLPKLFFPVIPKLRIPDCQNYLSPLFQSCAASFGIQLSGYGLWIPTSFQEAGMTAKNSVQDAATTWGVTANPIPPDQHSAKRRVDPQKPAAVCLSSDPRTVCHQGDQTRAGTPWPESLAVPVQTPRLANPML